ncbi:sensor histidine kinase [Streptomyces geranii]|uniref:sensor histidine kinase n=1 Tax=Streptomyces geranii TaxID=2058923 RepID=UPI0013009F47|nr:histidine kinase [Streptomyces geranii]
MESGEGFTKWTGRRQPADGDTRTRVPPSRFATYLLYAVLSGYLARVSVDTYASGAPALQVVACAACFSVLCALQILHARPRSAARGVRYRAAALSAQVLLTYVPLHWLGNPWEAAGDFLAGSVLLLLPSRLKWQVFLAVVAGNPVLAGLRHNGLAFVTSTASSTLVTGLAIYTISRMAHLMAELRRTQARLGYAISQERQRFARDLHDLLGYSLSAITLKTEVAMRYVPHRHEQVKEELTSILTISRQALSDVRHVAHGYQSLSLATELEECVALLRSASIDVDVRTSVPPPEGRTGTVLAIVLREAVTNMLQHSKVRHCEIALDRRGTRLRLRILNDGTDQEYDAADAGGVDGANGANGADGPKSSPSRGSRGLTNLETRLAAVGGTLTAGRRPGGHFEMLAEVPDGWATGDTADGHWGGRQLLSSGARDWRPEQERRRDPRAQRPDPNGVPGTAATRCDHLLGWKHPASTPTPRGYGAEP